jgi:hypothetical protein
VTYLVGLLTWFVLSGSAYAGQIWAQPDPTSQGSNQVLELNRAQTDLPQESERALKLHRQPAESKLHGCWSAVIHRSDLTGLQRTGSLGLGRWSDERYRICFNVPAKYGVSGNAGVTVDAQQLDDEWIQYERADAQVLESGPDSARIRSRLVWTDMDELQPGLPRPVVRPMIHIYQVIQLSELDAQLIEDRLRVRAHATATANYAPAYQLSWTAWFNRDGEP